jgi:hypothetical protein
MTMPTQRPAGGPRTLGGLLGKVIEPVTAKRGFATADLLAAWPDLVGPRFAASTQPERINWPRGRERTDAAGTLIVRVGGGHAVYLQHELGVLRERINSFLGFHAIGDIRLVQTPFTRTVRKEKRTDPALSPDRAEALERQIGTVEDEGLRDALRILGRAILSADKKT